MFGSVPNFIRLKILRKEDETVLPELLFGKILLQSINAANITEPNTLALLCTQYLLWRPKNQFRDVMR